MNTEDLRNGCVYHAKRWSGDTHADLGGTIDEAATDALMAQAADEIDRLRRELAEEMGFRGDAHEQRDKLATLAGELIAMVRVNAMRGATCRATDMEIDAALKPWVDRLENLK